MRDKRRLGFLGVSPSGERHSERDASTGRLANRKVRSVANRHLNHSDTNPRDLDFDGDGCESARGTVFSLPCYMVFCHGFVHKNQ